ncbi:hypothetical protein SL003B_1632 [Polymorphum gilvum SL003B-26A1]|uniref:Uncharacterized protein n=2 Tax=Polymorphum TaxID=991903 RepID=F2J518_POLGS|nr:hypothetical protein SL003B_1632 [Polymorphum gilvum SL003B-26A1]
MGCAGFVAAGVIGSLYQLVTNTPPRFQIQVESLLGTLASFVMCVFAGPFIIMRNAIRGRRIEGRPIGWLLASSTIAGMWSVCSGLLMIQFAIGLAGTF